MTELLYLQDTYLFESTGTIIEIGNDETWNYIILDKTIFYPQGWWQPTDTGTISDGKNAFQVEYCRLNKEWIVYHYGRHINEKMEKGKEVKLSINTERRIVNARNHSAGHLLDVAMIRQGFHKTLTPTKWYHFSDGAYVEYEWNFWEDKEVFIDTMNRTLKELVEENISIAVQYENLWELEAPKGKTPRYVAFEGFEWCWCGGTHVRNSWEIGKMLIRKIKHKKGVLRVSYKIW